MKIKELKEKILSWIILGIGMIKKEDLIYAIKNKVNPSKLIFNEMHKYLEAPGLKQTFQFLLKCYWNDIEPYITDANKVFEFLIDKRPDLKEILNTPEGRRYLNYVVANFYIVLYEWVWFNRNPFLVDKNAQ